MNIGTLTTIVTYLATAYFSFLIGRMSLRAGTSYMDGYRKGTNDTVASLKKLLLKHTNTDTQ